MTDAGPDPDDSFAPSSGELFGSAGRAVSSIRTRLSAVRSTLPTIPPDSRLRYPIAYVRRCVTIDSRSLAAFRVAIALLILADLTLRSRNFRFYYTDDGVVTQELAASLREPMASVFFFTSDPTLIAGLFVLHALIAIALLVGYKTRLATVLSFVFVLSLDAHNPLVLSYADTLFVMLLFWAIFLPLGERWSIDALQRDRPSRSAVATLATAAIMTQMVFMYFVNGQHKYPSERWHSGEAAIIVMGIDEMTFLLGDFMRHYPELLQLGGRTWFYILLASPLLILLYGRARYPLLILFAGGHASFAVTVRIGAFAFVALAGLLVFVQPRLWADLLAVLSRCRLDRPVAFVRTELARPGPLLADRLPGRLIDVRGRDPVGRTMLSVFVVIAIVVLFVVPAASMAAAGPYVDDRPLLTDNPIERTTADLPVSQPEWSIFAGPGPRSVDRYYVFPAKTADGDVFDVYNERPMTYDRPGQQLQRQHDTYRERFYMNSIRRSTGNSPELLAEHLCETWADERGIELTNVNMYEVTERITLETIDEPDRRERSIELLSRHSCGDHPITTIQPPDDRDELPPAERDDAR